MGAERSQWLFPKTEADKVIGWLDTAAVKAEIGKRWTERTGTELLDGIGSTEMLHIYVSNAPGDIKYGSSGKPVPGYAVRLVNEAGGNYEVYVMSWWEIPFRSVVRQQYDFSCGSAAMAEVPEASVARAIASASDGRARTTERVIVWRPPFGISVCSGASWATTRPGHGSPARCPRPAPTWAASWWLI